MSFSNWVSRPKLLFVHIHIFAASNGNWFVMTKIENLNPTFVHSELYIVVVNQNVAYVLILMATHLVK